MAIISVEEFFSQLNAGAKWDAAVSFKRGNPLPIDDKSVFPSLETAQEYAQSATAYPGQIIAVVTSSETTFYGINQLGELQDLGGSSAPMLFVTNESEMLALEDIKAGQQVYREDTHTVWIFKGGDASQTSNWVESASQNDTVWQGTENRVNFYALTKTQYDGIGSKDANTLYFLTDVGMIYKGTTNVTASVSLVSDFPEVASAISGLVYINTTSFEIRVKNNDSWLTASPGYLTDGVNWADADSSKMATIGLIKKGITESFGTILGTGAADVVLTATAAGGIQRTTKKIGGSKLSDTADAETLATEAAVLDLFSWGTI